MVDISTVVTHVLLFPCLFVVCQWDNTKTTQWTSTKLGCRMGLTLKGSLYHLSFNYSIWSGIRKNEKTSQYCVFLFFSMHQTLKTGVYFPIFSPIRKISLTGKPKQNTESNLHFPLLLGDFPRYISAVWPHFEHAQCIVWYLWSPIAFSIKYWGREKSLVAK